MNPISKPVESPQVQPTLAHTAFSALKWNYAGTVGRMGANFAVGMILARLLGPRPYGQVAVAALVIGLGNLVADVGLGSAIVQKEEVSSEDIRFAFTVQMLFAVIVVCTIWPLTPWIAAFFHQPETALVVRALIPMFILQALGQTATSLLKRNLQQKRIQTAQLISYLVGYVGLGIPFAVAGGGVWSLVLAQLAQSMVNSILVYASARHALVPLLWTRSAHMLRYGGKAVSTNVVSWSIGNLDNLFVGRAFGALELGLYSRSYTLVSMPGAALVSTLQAVLFPAYSRNQSNTKSLRQTYLASVAIIAMLMLPLFAVVAVIPHAVIGGIYGPKWLAAAPVVVPLALAMPLDSLMALAGPVLWGVGKVEREMWAQIATAVVMAGMMVVMSRISFVAVGWGVLGIYLLRATLLTRAAIGTLELQWADVGRALRVAAFMALATALIVGGVDRLLLVQVASMGLRLCLDAAISFITYVSFTFLFSPLWTDEMRWVFAYISHEYPAVAQPIMRATKIRLG
jgi:O-antigen/teichoic acid export membrane protein